jgi:hypothetical protein
VMLAADRRWHRYSRATRSTSRGSMFKGQSSTSPTPRSVYQAPPRHELRVKQLCALGVLVFGALIVRELRRSAAPSGGAVVYTLPELRALQQRRLRAASLAGAARVGRADA